MDCGKCPGDRRADSTARHDLHEKIFPQPPRLLSAVCHRLLAPTAYAPHSRSQQAHDSLMIIPEYPLALRSLNDTAIRASAVADERSTEMLDELHFNAIMADRQRELDWANKHGWKFAHQRGQRQSQNRRAAVARLLRALAAKLAPVDAESAVERGPLAAES
jgi:hypothetical protein